MTALIECMRTVARLELREDVITDETALVNFRPHDSDPPIK
jgi:hypothetical protein